MLGGDLAKRQWAASAGIGEDDVEGSAFGFHRCVEPAEIGLIGNRAFHRTGIGPQFGHCVVERLLPATEDEDESAFLDETLSRRKADAGSTAGNHGGLAIESGHGVHPWLQVDASKTAYL
ncbi:hypothetical protein D3C87_1466490 [compost metagenome]